MRNNNYFRTWMRSLFALLLIVSSTQSFAQTTLATTLLNNNGSSIVIGTLYNANASPIIINSIYCAPGSTTTQTFQLWTKPIAGFNLGAPGAVSVVNGWTLQASNTLATTAQTTQTGTACQQVMSGLNVSLAPGYYRFCIAATSIRYSTIGVQACSFTAGGVTLNYCASNGYGGTLASPTNTPRGLVGAITFSASTPCSGVPAPGNTVSSSASACVGVPLTLSLQNNTSGTGVSYQWYADAGAGYSSVGGATNSTYVVSSQSVATSYYCDVTCSAGGTTSSIPVAVTQNTPMNCYCTPPQSTNYLCCAMYMSNVNTTGGITDFSQASIEGTASYQDYSISRIASQLQGNNVTMNVTTNGYGMYMKVWIDFNDNGLFTDLGEQVLGMNSTPGLFGGTIASTYSQTFTVPAAAPAGTHRMRVRADYYGNGTGVPADPCGILGYGETEDYGFTVIVPTACSGTPVPGNTISSASPVCAANSFNLSLQNAGTLGSGTTFQWQSSPTGSGYTNIGGATNSTLSTTQSSATYYQCEVTCTNGGASAISNPLLVTQNTFTNCYCVGTASCTAGDHITLAAISTMSNSSGACLGSSGNSAYSNYMGTVAAPNLIAGTSYTVSGAVNNGGTEFLVCWIDFNHSGTFDASEYQNLGTGTGGSPSWNFSATMAIPGSALSGTTAIRFRSQYSTVTLAGGACTAQTYGETEDYLVNIVPLPADPANPTEVGVPNCASGGTIQATGSAPIGEVWYWQSSASGTSLAQDASTPLTILANGTYYIRSYNTANTIWSAGAGSITVTDFPAGPANPTTSAPGGNPACGAVTLVSSVATAGSTNYWQGTNATGTSTASVADDGSTNTPYPAPASGTYYVRAQDNTSFCWSNPVATAVSIYPLPTAPIVSASPTTVCPGTPTSLSAVAPSAPPTGYSVSSLSYATMPSPETTTLPNAGPVGDEGTLVANIGFNFNYYGTVYTQVQIHTNGYIVFGSNNYVFGGYSPTGTIPTATATNNWFGHWADMNASAGQISYETQGVSPNRKFIVNYNHDQYYSATPYYSGQLVVNESDGSMDIYITHMQTTYTSAIGCENLAGTLGTAAPGHNNVAVAADNEAWHFAPIQAMGFLWSANTALNGGIASGNEVLPNTTGNPTANTIYTMTLTEPDHNCQSSNTVTVNVSPTPAAPTVTNGSTTCGAGTVSVSAVGGGGTLQWWDAASGGNSLGNGVSSVNVSVINADVTVWVEEFNGTCAGPRAAVTAFYTAPPAITVSSDVSFVCYGGTNTGPSGDNNNTANLSSTDGGGTYSSFTWMPGNLSGQTVAVTPSATTTFTVTAVGSGCTNVSTVSVTGGVVPVINSVTATPTTVCQGGNSQLIASVAGGSGGSTPPTGYCSPIMFVGVNTCDYIQSVATTGGVTNFSNVTGSTWATGDTYYPASIVSQTLGGSFTLSVQAGGACSISYYDIWIDWNRDGAFNMTDEHMVTANSVNTGNTLTNFTINIPVTASPGATRMRVTNHGNSANPLTACDNLTANYSENEDYVVEVLGGGSFTYAWTGAGLSATNIFNPVATLGAPSTLYGVTVTDPYGCHSAGSVTLTEPSSNPGNTQSTVNPVCATTSYTLSVQNPGVGASYQWESSLLGVVYVPIGGATNSTYTTTQSQSTYYRCSVGCPSGGSYSNPLQVISNPPTACYCSPSFTNYDGTDYIANVTLNTLNNTTVGTPIPCYTNYSPMGTSLLLSQSYTISMSAGTFTGENYSAWIDFNQSGSFEESERILPNSVNTTGGETFTATFTVPSNAIPGTTRMRCVDQYASAATPCPTSSYGEAEDYEITIIAPNATSNSPVCQGSELQLFSPTTGLSYSWTTTAANAFTSTLKDPVIPNAGIDAAGVYTVVITFASSSMTASVTVVINPSPFVVATASSPFCEGTAGLDLNSMAPTAVSYEWKKVPSNTVLFTIPFPTIPAAPASASGTYRSIVTDANGCKDSATVVATVWALPTVDITVIGSSNLCTGQTTSDLQGTGVPASGYSWSTTETTDLITVSTGGTYTLTGTDANGCINTDVAVITESAAPAAPVVTPAGPINLCSSDGGMTYSSATLTVQNYSSDLLWSTSESTTSITVDYADIFNVTYTDPAGCYSVSNPVVTNALLASSDPTSATSNITTNNVNNICLGNNVILSVNGGSLGDGADWYWYEGTGACGTGTARGTGSSVTITPTTAGVHHYTVRAEGTCGPTNCSSIDITVSSAPPSGTIHVTAAPVAGCNGQVSLVSVNAVSGATYYSWNGTSGALYSSSSVGPFVAGPYQTSGPSVYVQFANPAPAGNSGYNICCFAANACGQSNTICTWVRSKVSQPGVISGGLIACASSSSTYSIAPVVGANTYTWTITGNANINGGGATLTTASPSITVNFLGGWSSGTLSVYASLTCGFNSASRNLNIVNTPAIPGAMTGPGYVCPGGSSSFSVSAVPGAASYNWTTNVPGAVITPAGNTASIAFPAVIPAGSLVCVTSVSSCGFASPQRCKSIASGIPNIPGVISGPTFGQCGQSGVSYSITPVFGATSYLWSTSSTQAAISGPNNLSAASVNFTSTFSSVTLSVVANSACGASAPRTLSVNGFPGLPAVIAGDAAPCAGTVQSYSTTGSGGATSYNWTWPVGTTLVGGQGTSNLLVLIGSTAGDIGVTASNDCGTSGTRTFAITIPCRQGQVEASVGSTSTSLYPNPTSGKTTVKFESANAAKYVISVVDVTGRVIISDEVSAAEGINMHELDLSKVAKGIYLVRMETAGEQAQLLKVTVE